MSLADKFIVMRDVHILQIDAPMDHYNRPRNIFTTRFLGSPEIKIIGATLRDGCRILVSMPDPSVGSAARAYPPTTAKETS